jgi:hypothetical protein
MTVGRIPSVEGGIQPTLLTTKGDIIVATGNATLVRQGVGANGTVLTANSAQADGVEWVAPASGALTLIKTATFSSASSSSTTFDSVISATYDNYLVLFNNFELSGVDASLYFQYRKAGATKNSGSYYGTFYGYSTGTTTAQNWTESAATQGTIMKGGPGADGKSTTELTIFNSNYPRYLGSTYNGYRNWELQGGSLGYLNDTIDGFILTPSAGTFSGSVIIYGLAKS